MRLAKEERKEFISIGIRFVREENNGDIIKIFLEDDDGNYISMTPEQARKLVIDLIEEKIL